MSAGSVNRHGRTNFTLQQTCVALRARSAHGLKLFTVLSAAHLARAGLPDSPQSFLLDEWSGRPVLECPRLYSHAAAGRTPQTLYSGSPLSLNRSQYESSHYFEFRSEPTNQSSEAAYSIVVRPSAPLSVDTMVCLYTPVELSECGSSSIVCARLQASNEFAHNSASTLQGVSHVQWHSETRQTSVFIGVYAWPSGAAYSQTSLQQQLQTSLQQHSQIHVSLSLLGSSSLMTHGGCRCYNQSIAADGSIHRGCDAGWCDVEPNCTAAYLGKTGGNPYAGWDRCDSTDSSWKGCSANNRTGRDWRVGLKQDAAMCADQLDAIVSKSGEKGSEVLPDICSTIVAANPERCDQLICTAFESLKPGLRTLDASSLVPGHLLSFYCSASCGTCHEVCPFDGDGICDASTMCPLHSDSDCECNFKNDGICDEGQLCPFGSDSDDCCPSTGDGICDEGRLCPPLSDRLDCFCAGTMNGICDEARIPVHSHRRSGSAGLCALFSDYADCNQTADRNYCPPQYVNSLECDAGEKCPCNTDVEDCSGDPEPGKITCTSELLCDSDFVCESQYDPLSYCAQYSEYSYKRQCEACADRQHGYQISTRSVDLLGSPYSTSPALGKDEMSTEWQPHTCSDFSDSLDRNAECIHCEWGFNPQTKLIRSHDGSPLIDQCHQNQWRLRLWSPEGNGWEGAQYRINACNYTSDCGILGSTLIARGSPVARRHSGVQGVRTEFTRNVCWKTLDKLGSSYTLTDTPGANTGLPACYRLTSWWKPDHARNYSTPIRSQMISWELTDTGQQNSILASGGVGTFLFAIPGTDNVTGSDPETENSIIEGANNRRLQDKDGCHGVSVCGEGANIVVEVHPELDSETGLLRRHSRERWTLISSSTQYEFPLCKQFPRAQSEERVEGAENCIRVPSSGKITYSLCLPCNDNSDDDEYRFTFFSSAQKQSNWTVTVTMPDGSQRMTSRRVCRTTGNNDDGTVRVSQTCTLTFSTNTRFETTPPEACSTECDDSERKANTPCLDCGGRCSPSHSLANGQCDAQWNCAAYGYDMDACRSENGDGWAVATFDDKQSRTSFLSISEGDHQQLVLSSNGVVYTQSPDSNNRRDETFASSSTVSAPAGSCSSETDLHDKWFCCIASESLTFWYDRVLQLSMSTEGRIWSAGGQGYFDQDDLTGEQHNLAEYDQLLSLLNNSGMVGRLCLSNPCGVEDKTIGNWDLLEVFDMKSGSWDLNFFWHSELKFSVKFDGNLWTSYRGGFFLNRTRLGKSDILPPSALGNADSQFKEVVAQISVSGSYSLYVDGEHTAQGVGCINDCADDVPQSDQHNFGVYCETDPLVIVIAATCLNAKSHGRCAIKFQADIPRPPMCTDTLDQTLYTAAESEDGSGISWKCHPRSQSDDQCRRDGRQEDCWAARDYDDSNWAQPTSYGSGAGNLGYDPLAVWPTGGDDWRWSKHSEWIWLEDERNETQVVCRGTRKIAVASLDQGQGAQLNEPPSSFAWLVLVCILAITLLCAYTVWRMRILHSRKFEGLLEQAIFDGEYSGFQTVSYAPDQMENAVHESIMSRFEEDTAAIETILHESALEDLEIECVIGRGSSSVVYRAVWKGRQVALKQLVMDSAEVMQVLDEFAGEIRIMSKLHHPNVIQYLGFTTTPRCLIIQEYASNGNLRSYLDPFATQPDHPDAPTQVMQLSMALDIVRGMAYLHTQQPIVLHRDLKSPNLLLDLRDGEFFVKITDFGLAREKSELAGATGLMTVCGTPLWTAPEILKGENYNEKADVFSAALCIWELWSFTVPHAELGMGPMEVVLKVASENIRPRIPDNMPAFFAELIQRCWSVDPNDRPQFPELIRHVKSYASSVNMQVRYDSKDVSDDL